MSKKTLLLIAGVAIMLAGATSAHAYHEIWDGWFDSGSLHYNSKTYTVVENNLIVNDSTYSPTRDTFYLTVDVIAFVCAAGYNDSIFVCIPTFTGGKETGTSGTHLGDGSWSGSGYSDRSATNKLFDIWGTWGTYIDPDCFNYGGLPPIYDADWRVIGSNPEGFVTGSGTCSGQRTYYSP
jgi:hypothetical protein